MKKKLPFCEGGPVSYAWPVIARVLGLGCLLNILSITVQAQAKLIRDVDRREEVMNNEYSFLRAGATDVYFLSWSTLWKTGGTRETTNKVKTFGVSSILMVGNTAYLAAGDAQTGSE